MSNGAPPPPPFQGAFLGPPPLPPFWTEHLAPAGQAYWYNSQTKVSTYSRPLGPPPPPPGAPAAPSARGTAGAASSASHFAPSVGGTGTTPAGKDKKEKKEKPKTKTPLEGTEWTRVLTNKGNIFYTNAATKESVWTVPLEIKEAVERLEAEERGEGGKRKVDDVEEPIEVKKKRTKKVTVRSIEELEGDEDWQRQVAEQMAKEAQEAEAAELALEDEIPVVKVEVKVEDPVIKEAPAPQTPKIEVSPEEGIALFKAMLSEKGISPMAPWDNELPKFVDDSRYHSVRLLKDRRDLFDEFCKEKIRSLRAAKKAAQEGGLKLDPLTAYRSLLTTAVTSTRTHFSDFKKSFGKDPRFREFGKTEGEKEKVFRSFLRELGEKKREMGERAEKGFRELLAEKASREGAWSEVKSKLSSDPRYLAVASSSQRESLYNAFRSAPSSSSSTAPSDAHPVIDPQDKVARAAASLRDREQKVREEQYRSGRNLQAARGALGREEGEREFGVLLVDTVRDHNAKWDQLLPSLSRDPRFSSSTLSPGEQRRLFENHLVSLYTKRLSTVHGLFNTHAPSLITPFHELLPSLLPSPHVLRLVGPSATDAQSPNLEALEALYDSWSAQRTLAARGELVNLLKENPLLEHWGRHQKSEQEKEATGGMKDGGDEEQEEQEEGFLGIREMAAQVDLKAVEAVLKHDKRYLMFDHVAEERSGWIQQFIAELQAPRTTVHQRE